MKEVSLNSQKYPNLFAIVDDEDYERVVKYHWRPCKVKHVSIPYVATNIYGEKGNRTTMLLHRFVSNALSGEIVDHIDRNPLNNQKSNLRKVSYSESNINQNIQSNNTSGYRGVSWDKRSEKWSSNIRKNNKLIHLGYFSDKEEAAKKYDEAAKKYHEGFAQLNFP